MSNYYTTSFKWCCLGRQMQSLEPSSIHNSSDRWLDVTLQPFISSFWQFFLNFTILVCRASFSSQCSKCCMATSSCCLGSRREGPFRCKCRSFLVLNMYISKQPKSAEMTLVFSSANVILRVMELRKREILIKWLKNQNIWFLFSIDCRLALM